MSIMKTLFSGSEKIVFRNDEVQVNVRYTNLYGNRYPFDNDKLRNNKFKTISSQHPVFQALIDQEHFNDYFEHMRNHYGWTPIPITDINYLNQALNISLPTLFSEIQQYFPEFANLESDTPEIDYHYTLNSVKDSLLDNTGNLGVRFDSDGTLILDQKIAVRISVYIGGYRTEIRTLYPHLKAHLKLTI